MAENGRNPAPLILLGAGIALLGRERKPRLPVAHNQPPVLIVAEELLVLPVGHEAVLDASLSYDPEGSRLTFLWEVIQQPDGAAVEILTDQPVARFTSEVPGEYWVTLTISDGIDEVTETLRVIYGAEPYHELLGLLDQLEDGLNGVAQGLGHLAAMVENAQSMVEDLHGRLDHAGQLLDHQQEDLQRVLGELQELLDLATATRGLLDQAASIVANLRARNGGADQELAALAALIDQAQANLAAMQDLSASLYATISELSGQNAVLQAELQAAQALAASLISQLVVAQNQIEHLQGIVSDLQELVAQLQYLIEPVEKTVTVKETDTSACSLNILSDRTTILIHFTQAVRLDWNMLAQVKACALVPNIGQADAYVYPLGSDAPAWHKKLRGENASQSGTSHVTLSPGAYEIRAVVNPPASSRLKATYLVPRFLAE